MKCKLRELIWILLILLVPVENVYATAIGINFGGITGGTVSYLGGTSNPLVGAGLPINFVYNIPNTLFPAVSSGNLVFTTGNYTGGTGSNDIFSSGGSLTITGGVLAASIPIGSTLLSGTFVNSPTLTCCSSGSAIFSGNLSISSVDSTLASYLGLALPAGSGSIAQLNINISAVPSGTAFSGQQGSVNVLALSAPEPSSLILLGFGLIGLAIWGRKRYQNNES